MKRSGIFIPILLFVFQVQAQIWFPLASGVDNAVFSIFTDSTDGSVYAGGRFIKSGTTATKYIGRWNSGQWQAVGDGLDGYVRTITRIGNKIYAGGEFAYSKDSAINCFGEWNGTSF